MDEIRRIRKREEVPREETWATEDIFPDDAAWEAEFKAVKEELKGYGDFKGRLGASAGALYGVLRFDAMIGERLDRLYSYAHLNSDADTNNQKYQQMVGKAAGLCAAASAASAYIPSEILAIPEDQLDALRASEEADREFDISLDEVLRKKAHTRSPEVEELLADASEMAGGPSRIFQMFNNADTRFPAIPNEEGQLEELTHGRYIRFLESGNRNVRRAAFKAMYETFGHHKNTLAAAFQANVKQAWFYAKARRYPSSRAFYMDDADVPEQVYDTLIETVRESLPLMYRYVELRKKVLGLSELHLYDLYTPLVPQAGRRVPYGEAKKLVKEALAPLGDEYLAALEKGFSERWVDYGENEGKRSGAYSGGPYGVHPYVLMSYQGNLDSVFTLAHEMGHAMHSYFSGESQNYPNAQYRIFVAEVASTCNENLLNRYLLEHTSDPMERAYILNHFLDGFKGTVFRQTMFAEFEKTAHDLSRAGEVLTAERLCGIYKKLNEDYFGDGVVIDDEIALEWARIPHFYRPFYVYQYATGFSAATALSERILSEGGDAVRDYMGFLRGGCTRPPIRLLADAGVDMRSPEAVRKAMGAFGEALTELCEILKN